MISWLPDEVLRSACQMACYGFAALTAAITFLFMPRWYVQTGGRGANLLAPTAMLSTNQNKLRTKTSYGRQLRNDVHVRSACIYRTAF